MSPSPFKCIALWAYPRTVSTAVERIFIERSDSETLHEPFFSAYYYSDQRNTRRMLSAEISEEKRTEDYFTTIQKIVTSIKKPILFFKDMAFYSYPYLKHHYPDFYSKLVNTFIIRDPKESLYSHYKISPDLEFYPEESGIVEQYELFHYVTQTLQQPAIVIDAGHLTQNPVEVMKAYCQRVGIGFHESAMHWEKRKIKVWEDWESWHEEVENSTTIQPVSTKKLEAIIPEKWLAQLIEDSYRCYNAMYAHAITSKNE